MKGLCCVLLFAVALSAADIGMYSIGQSCDASSPFVVTNLDINPYPPTSAVQMTVNMAGAFSQDEYVSDIAIRTSYNRGSWVYKYVDIGQKFVYGQIYTFSFPITAGNAIGLYETQILLERKQGSGISCWDFTYHI